MSGARARHMEKPSVVRLAVAVAREIEPGNPDQMTLGFRVPVRVAPLTQASEPVLGEISATIQRFQSELEYHERRADTLRLAIEAMKGEENLLLENADEIPPEILSHLNWVRECYRAQRAIAKGDA